ncbi:MAG: hypothetical protein RKP20_09785 [Candidatus Competibacter sp.]|nr:hypothetical protein [Candidatus Competibacter sp.]
MILNDFLCALNARLAQEQRVWLSPIGESNPIPSVAEQNRTKSSSVSAFGVLPHNQSNTPASA